MMRALLVLSALALAGPGAAAQGIDFARDKAQSIAIVIGVRTNQTANSPVEFAERDAAAISEYLIRGLLFAPSISPSSE